MFSWKDSLFVKEVGRNEVEQKEQQTLLVNARILTASGVKPGEVLVKGEKIKAVGRPGELTLVHGHKESITLVDAAGRYLSPGFIDIHTHGGGGWDFMDGSLEGIYKACKSHLYHGTTSIMPTTITSTTQSLLDFVDLFQQVELCRPEMPHILGLHLEGPYFADSQRGAQAKEHLRSPQPEEYEAVLTRTDRIRRWSFAIELPGAKEFLQTLVVAGIVPSLAHSAATCVQTIEAYENGVRALTHFYSGMESVHRINAFRVGGAVEAGYLLDDLYVEVIADGCHLPAELLQLIYKVKGPDRICLVTDSMRAAGMPDGNYKLGNRESGLDTIVEDGVAKLPDRSAFAGSVATADRLVRTFRQLTDAPLYQCVKMMTLTPARLMGIDGMKGSIRAGCDADLLLFDEDVHIFYIMVRGVCIKNER